MLIGLYVEKGVAPMLSELYKSNTIMNNSWMWYQFYEDMKSEKIDDVIYEIIKNTQQTVYFTVHADYIENIETFNPEEKESQLEYRYIINHDSIKIIKAN